jgi:hypothetical protein
LRNKSFISNGGFTFFAFLVKKKLSPNGDIFRLGAVAAQKIAARLTV